MKTYISLLLLLCSLVASSQVDFEPEGSLKKNGKYDIEKIRLGLSAQLDKVIIAYPQLIFSVNAYHKNKQFSAGGVVLLNQPNPPTNTLVKKYGYNLVFRYFFPQNKGGIKAFIPLEFEHIIHKSEMSGYYDHLLPKPSSYQNLANPGYSFNLNIKSFSQNFSVKTGLGVFIWPSDYFNIQLHATIGTIFSLSKRDYFNADSESLLDSENFNLKYQDLTGVISIGFGFRF